MLGAVRMDLVVEEHGQGKQLVRFRAWPRCTGVGLALIVSLLLVALVDAGVASWQGGMICLVPAMLLVLRTLQECAAGMAVVKASVKAIERQTEKVERILPKVTPRQLGISPPPPPMAGAPHATLLPKQVEAQLAPEG